MRGDRDPRVGAVTFGIFVVPSGSSADRPRYRAIWLRSLRRSGSISRRRSALYLARFGDGGRSTGRSRRPRHLLVVWRHRDPARRRSRRRGAVRRCSVPAERAWRLHHGQLRSSMNRLTERRPARPASGARAPLSRRDLLASRHHGHRPGMTVVLSQSAAVTDGLATVATS